MSTKDDGNDLIQGKKTIVDDLANNTSKDNYEVITEYVADRKLAKDNRKELSKQRMEFIKRNNCRKTSIDLSHEGNINTECVCMLSLSRKFPYIISDN